MANVSTRDKMVKMRRGSPRATINTSFGDYFDFSPLAGNDSVISDITARKSLEYLPHIHQPRVSNKDSLLYVPGCVVLLMILVMINAHSEGCESGFLVAHPRCHIVAMCNDVADA
eukprot:10103290-Ditylum_brightwellii.AAC.1